MTSWVTRLVTPPIWLVGIRRKTHRSPTLHSGRCRASSGGLGGGGVEHPATTSATIATVAMPPAHWISCRTLTPSPSPNGFSQPPGSGHTAEAFRFEPRLAAASAGSIGGVFRAPPDLFLAL